MASQVVNGFDEVLTPSRKRKRELDEIRAADCNNGLTNEGFSSTPKKEAKLLIGSLHKCSGARNYRDSNLFTNGACLEIKSIAEIADEQNPYEVVRKPPKKKKRADITCFENLALNLEGPETRFNPFEVKRLPLAKKDENCFINSALNIKSPENAALNPYEIARSSNIPETIKEGIENPALDEPSTLTIGLPFTPTLGCRIDFNNISPDSLTPSKLLAEKLVFSPITTKGLTPYKHFRRSLSVISEETVDIGMELDCYQLELENSINEAKLKKTGRKYTMTPSELHLINESIDSKSTVLINSTNVSNENISETDDTSVPDAVEVKDPAEDSFETDDFKTPAPFVRCYRKSAAAKLFTQTELINKSTSSGKSKPEHVSNKHKVADVIRKSFRKLIHSRLEYDKNNKTQKDENATETIASNFMSTIRHSLRRRNKNDPKSYEIELLPDENPRNYSILDTAEHSRKIFRFSAECGDRTNKLNEDINGKPSNLRRSLRRSTRDIRNQVLKTVFHRNIDEYKMNC